MHRASSPLIGAALDLAWSHWTGLGVRGAIAAPDCAVDPEALIYLTAALADIDPRLWEEATSWWDEFSEHLSPARLSRLAAAFDQATQARVAMHRSRPTARRGESHPSKSRLDDLEHPARTLLRLRCAFGASARAEILLALLTDWGDAKEGVTALTLSEIGYSKRNVAVVLDDLAMAGIVIRTPDANRTRYRVARTEALRSLLAPVPRLGGRWQRRMPLIARLVALSTRLRDKDALIQAVEARKLITEQQRELAALGLGLPRGSAAETYWDDVQRWAIDDVIRTAGNDLRELPGQLVGSWHGPRDLGRSHGQPTGAVLPPLGSDVTREAALACLDLVQVTTIDPPGDWTWMVLSEAAANVYEHTLGLARGERWRFVTRLGGTERAYVARLGAPLPHAEIARLYGSHAVARARRDHPAVRLHLEPA